ncbi:MAG: glycerol-3-phosphate dehydrogenase [Gemmatimonadales bacterium]|nr:glycerol-3-phosphate dehydrogenase [Gemmatimonadales bacterium]MYG20000.1 glycerol-3-phosphate dehydrogenase [Gemmatimonadales bacterium]
MPRSSTTCGRWSGRARPTSGWRRAGSSGSSSSSRDPGPVTAPGRAERFRNLAATAFDILVIGGGISGAAVARDAARRGFRTALVEAADFASGTSSRSSRLVHGGLRYLEHFEFDLVFEASQERRTLLRIATHLVRPLEFHFPIFRDGRIGRMKLDAGMWLYDALSLFRNIERHQMLDTEAMLAREPGLRAEGLLGGARYFDAQVDDARLVVTTIVAAVEAGATVVNRAEVVRVDASDWPGHRALVRDAESGREVEVDALAVVNATGAWAEQMLDRVAADARGPGPGEGAAAAVRIRPSRGTHIHVARERVGHSGAVIFEAPRDGRVMFILPWREDLTLIGTTDEFFDGRPHEVAATPGDIAYLVEATRHLLPASKLGPEDVISAWAGLRPLVAPAADGDDEGAVSREFEVHQHPPGIFTLSGGKLTSHRHMAEATLDRVQAFLAPAGVKAIRKVDTDKVPLPGARFRDLEALRSQIRARARSQGLERASADRLTRAYGTRANRVLDLVDRNPRLGERVVAGRPHLLAEAVYSVRSEMALHVEDILFRRMRVGLETRSGTPEAARRVAEVVAPELDWTTERRTEEVKRALDFRAVDDGAIRELAARAKEGR